MKEQRKLERFDLKIPATIELVAKDEDSEKKILYVMTKNICSGGAFFNTMDPVPKGTEVRIGLVLNLGSLKGLKRRRSLIKVSGMVLRSEPTGMAIRFDESYKIMPLNKG